jgi:fructokinase
MRTIYCIGETVYDIIFKNGQPVAAKAGGSMLNSTVSMGRMKLPVSYISEYGQDDIGIEIDQFLVNSNVNTNCVYKYSEGKTSIAIAFLNEKNDARYSFYKHLPENRMDIKFPVVQANDIVLFGSFYSINKEIRKEVRSFVEQAKEARAVVVYDPNFRKAHLHELEELKPFILENMSLASLVRGSHEDFQMIFNTENLADSYSQVSKYCKSLIYTVNSRGVQLKTANSELLVNVPQLNPLSTIGAGDNFNAGFIYGLFKENINQSELSSLNNETWEKLLQHGIAFASEVCMRYDNYISAEFAEKYL